MKISFGDATENAWGGFDSCLSALLAEPTVRRVCEVGAGANPSIPIDVVQEMGLEYILLDLSTEELDKAPDPYEKVVADIASGDLPVSGRFDLVFSKMLAEHLREPELFHRNVYKLLNSGGRAFHFFPTLFALPFVVNRLLPEPLLERILLLLQPYRKKSGNHAKFPAYYKWCFGPGANQIERFRRIGYEVEEYRGFFGHEYFIRFPLLHAAHRGIVALLKRRPVPQLTSFAFVILRKP